MKVFIKEDCVGGGAALTKGKEYDLPNAIAQKLIDRGFASKDAPVKKVKTESAE
jgi:hypothetical protein